MELNLYEYLTRTIHLYKEESFFCGNVGIFNKNIEFLSDEKMSETGKSKY